MNFLRTCAIATGLWVAIPSLRASAVYSVYDAAKNEFILVADGQRRNYLTATGEIVGYDTVQKWRVLKNGAIFAACGKYVNGGVEGRTVFDLVDTVVTAQMTYQEAAEAIGRMNMEKGLLAMRNNDKTLFEATLMGFENGVPRLVLLRFPPENQLIPGRLPYYVQNLSLGHMILLCCILGEDGVLRNTEARQIAAERDKKQFLLSAMLRQISQTPLVVGKPVDVLVISNKRPLEHLRVEK